MELKRYDTPEVTEHGAAIDATRGDCSCRTEECGFQPAPSDTTSGSTSATVSATQQ